MAVIPDQLRSIQDGIADACARAGREFDSVELIAVSKTFPTAAIREAFDAGQKHFGESRLQEAEPKIDELPESIRWHFIGRVQRNKVRRILERFETVHGIDSFRLAQYADRIAGELELRAKVFLQVNIGREESKGGFLPEQLAGEMEQLVALSHLDFQGLMCIPPHEEQPECSRRWFAALRALRDRLQSDFQMSLPSLSMGMSGDFGEAILEGATHVRVGSAIFGNRSYRVDGELG